MVSFSSTDNESPPQVITQVSVTDASNVFAGLNLRRLDKDPLITWEGAGKWEEEYGSLGKGKENMCPQNWSFHKVNFSVTAWTGFYALGGFFPL